MVAREQEKSMAVEEATVVEKAWLSPNEVQAYAGIGRTKLWELLSRSEIEGAKVGRSVKVSRASIDEYMRRNAYADSKR